MPPSGEILEGLTTIANEWRTLAIAWHVALGVLLVGGVAGWRPPVPALGYLLALPIVSVSALAWASGNPFNGAVFTILALLLVALTLKLPHNPVQLSASWLVVPGVLLLAFAWVFLGPVPCPTLSVRSALF